MANKLNIEYDSSLVDSVSADFDLREPNKNALKHLLFTLNGDYNPKVMQVLNLATGVGKTYLMAALIEYLRHQGIGNVVIVTPGKVVQSKTIQNFTPGSGKYIPGAAVPPSVVTPQDYSAWIARINGAPNLIYGREVPMLAFIFNIQQLIAPKDIEGDTTGDTQDAIRRKPRRFDEHAGVLFDYLKGLDDLVLIADESHLYSSSAEAFNAALQELNPAASIGLTASVLPEDYVIYKYPLYQAIRDRYVKAPVLAFRKKGYGEDQAAEEQQLRDALQLRSLKQRYYDYYTAEYKLPHLNAIAFVVCADVEHATQVAGILRSPEYLGSEAAVLQVDSQHDDAATESLLVNLDKPESPVLAVVSVNKLKEGWDVKNIAVIVTLRAMASEVLTQQTMGRGLRLPFGKYTGIQQIDQLDIISHQSFAELLKAENVLQQFGLEEAIDPSRQAAFNEVVRNTAERGNNDAETDRTAGSSQTASFGEATQHGADMANQAEESGDDFGNGNTESDAATDTLRERGTGNDVPTVGIRTIPDNPEEQDDEYDWTPVVISRNPKFADVTYKFPVTVVELNQPPVDLSEIDDKEIEDAAKKVTSTGDVMYRKEIVAALGKKELRTVDAESAEVDSIRVGDDEAAAALIRLVMKIQLIPTNQQTALYVKKFLVPKFMKSVKFSGWTIKSLASAEMQLRGVLLSYIKKVQQGIKEIPKIQPKEINPKNDVTLPFGEYVHEPIDSRADFVPKRYYSGWFKSLFENESFDSYSGEYELAKILNTSPHIKWWHRLHPSYGMYIYYTAKDRYFPDFVACDDTDTYWIIEGKDKRGRDDETVQAKRKAAESLVRKLIVEKEYEGQKWGYLIAYEDDIAQSDSWDDLKVLAQPVTNIV